MLGGARRYLLWNSKIVINLAGLSTLLKLHECNKGWCLSRVHWNDAQNGATLLQWSDKNPARRQLWDVHESLRCRKGIFWDGHRGGKRHNDQEFQSIIVVCTERLNCLGQEKAAGVTGMIRSFQTNMMRKTVISSVSMFSKTFTASRGWFHTSRRTDATTTLLARMQEHQVSSMAQHAEFLKREQHRAQSSSGALMEIHIRRNGRSSS